MKVYKLLVILVCILCTSCNMNNPKESSTTQNTNATTKEDVSSLSLNVGTADKVSIPDPATASGNVVIDLMGKPNFEWEYNRDTEECYWTEESKKMYAGFLANLSFAGIDKPVFVSSYAIGNFTEVTGIKTHISKQTKKEVKEKDIIGSCLALFVTEVPDSMDDIDPEGDVSLFNCESYILLLDYKNGFCIKKDTSFFLQGFDCWVDYDAVDVTGDGVQELLLSHVYNKSLDFGVFRIDSGKKKMIEIYSTYTDSKTESEDEWDGEWFDTRDFRGTLLDNYKIRLRYSSLGYDKTVSMLKDGGYKEKDLHDKYDQWQCKNFVGLWKEDGSLYRNRAKNTDIFLATLDDIFLTKNKKGNMQIVFERSIMVGHRSETIGDMHAYFQYDEDSDSLVLKKVKYVNAKEAENEWKTDKNYGKVRVVD